VRQHHQHRARTQRHWRTSGASPRKLPASHAKYRNSCGNTGGEAISLALAAQNASVDERNPRNTQNAHGSTDSDTRGKLSEPALGKRAHPAQQCQPGKCPNGCDADDTITEPDCPAWLSYTCPKEKRGTGKGRGTRLASARMTSMFFFLFLLGHSGKGLPVHPKREQTPLRKRRTQAAIQNQTR